VQNLGIFDEPVLSEVAAPTAPDVMIYLPEHVTLEDKMMIKRHVEQLIDQCVPHRHLYGRRSTRTCGWYVPACN
jgi:hypothetical protein